MRLDNTRPAWRVVFPEHEIERPNGLEPFRLPAWETTRFEGDRGVAVAMAAIELHVREGMPAWRPYRRRSCEVAVVERVRAVAAAGRA